MEELKAEDRLGAARKQAGLNGGSNGGGRSNGNGAGELAGVELAAQRDAVVSYLQARFRGSLSEADIEDLAQGTCEVVLRKQVAGERIGDLAGLMRTIAWRDARDLIRDRREAAADPQEGSFAALEDLGAPADHLLDNRAELARAIEAVEQLEPEHRAAYRARFVDELSTREACERLGLPRSTYHHRLRKAVDAVQATLDPRGLAEMQLQLLGAYVSGIASRAERLRAERLIRSDPHSAAVVRELRGAHESTAAALAPVAIGADAGASALERLGALPGRLREGVAGLLGRSPEGGDAALGSAIASGGGRGAGVAASGALASLGGAGKVAIACLGAGAAAGACVATGIVPGVGGGAERPAREIQRPQREVVVPVAAEEPVRPLAHTPAPGGGVDSVREPQAAAKERKEAEAPVESSPVEPSAPPVEQEFGVAAAAAPITTSDSASTGSGGADTGSGGSAVQQEFGP